MTKLNLSGMLGAIGRAFTSLTILWSVMEGVMIVRIVQLVCVFVNLLAALMKVAEIIHRSAGLNGFVVDDLSLLLFHLVAAGFCFTLYTVR